MKRHVLAATIGAASLCAIGNSEAVVLNPKGLGQALIYPYYTVNKGQDTLLSIVNTGDLGKVARVRFHEGYNGRIVLDFLVFLSPHDVWNASIVAAEGKADSGAVLHTADRSCTLPALPRSGQPFTSLNYVGGVGSSSPADGGPNSIDRTREGHVEVIGIGDILPDSATDRRTVHLRTDIPGAAEPPGCLELTESNYRSDLVTPASTLAGAAGVVNVGEGTYFPFNAEALGDFTRQPLTSGAAVVYADGLDRANSGRNDGRVEATLFVDGKPTTLDYPRGIDAVSAVFMADRIHNELLLSPSLGASTDWIVTFPTKRYYVDPALRPVAPQPPFGKRFATPGEAPQAFGYHLYDTEEFDTTDECWVACTIPVTSPPPNLRYEVNTISLRRLEDNTPTTSSGVLGSRLFLDLRPKFPGLESGWASLHFDLDGTTGLGGGRLGNSEAILSGLPVTGFMVYNIINSNAQPGKLANYSGLFPHRSTTSCRLNDAPQPAPCE